MVETKILLKENNDTVNVGTRKRTCINDNRRSNMYERKEKVILSGDIWMANLSTLDADDNRQQGTRPVLVISNDINNKYSPLVNIYCFTTKIDKRHLPIHVNFAKGECGLANDSTLIVEQPITIDKKHLYKKIGAVRDENKLREVANAMAIQNPIINLLRK